jgi:endonuclease YncB( thermonuclease family)
MRTLISILILTALAAPALAQGPPPPIPPPLLEGQGIALDGNTLTLLGAGPDGGDLTVRLFAIDVPAMDTPDGPLARTALGDLIGETHLECVDRDIDADGRVIAVCFIGNETLAEMMLAMGHATIDRAAMAGVYLEDDYLAAERAARTNGLGLWAPD